MFLCAGMESIIPFRANGTDLKVAATSEVRDNTPENQWVTQRVERS